MQTLPHADFPVDPLPVASPPARSWWHRVTARPLHRKLVILAAGAIASGASTGVWTVYRAHQSAAAHQDAATQEMRERQIRTEEQLTAVRQRVDQIQLDGRETRADVREIRNLLTRQAAR